MWFVLASKPKDDEARMLVRWISADVRETPVKRHKNAVLGIADSLDPRVIRASKLLLINADRVPTRLAEERHHLGR